MNSLCILVSSPLSVICIENIFYLRDKYELFSLVLERWKVLGRCGLDHVTHFGEGRKGGKVGRCFS